MQLKHHLSLHLAVAGATALLAGAVALAASAAPLPAPAAPAAPVSNAVAAEVNGEPIMLRDVNRLVVARTRREPSLATGSEAAKKALESVRQNVLENLIDERLLAQEAKRRGIQPTRAQVDQVILQFKSNFKDEDDYKKSLAAEGTTPEYVRQSIAQQLAVDELTKQLTADVIVAPDDYDKYYAAHPDDFKVPAMVRVRHILLTVQPKAAAADRQKMQTRAAALLKEAQAPKDVAQARATFVRLAGQNSNDSSSSERGGDVGFLSYDDLVLTVGKAFADAAFATPPGKIAPQVVPSDYGYHILMVEEKRPARTVALADIKDQLKPLLLRDKIKARLDQSLVALRANAKIKRNI